jgi:hypothetical protein
MLINETAVILECKAAYISLMAKTCGFFSQQINQIVPQKKNRFIDLQV